MWKCGEYLSLTLAQKFSLGKRAAENEVTAMIRYYMKAKQRYVILCDIIWQWNKLIWQWNNLIWQWNNLNITNLHQLNLKTI